MISIILQSISKSLLSRTFCSASKSYFYFHPGFDPDNIDKFVNSFLIFDDILTEKEEETFMREMEPHLKRHVYEKDHWDDVI